LIKRKRNEKRKVRNPQSAKTKKAAKKQSKNRCNHYEKEKKLKEKKLRLTEMNNWHSSEPVGEKWEKKKTAEESKKGSTKKKA